MTTARRSRRVLLFDTAVASTNLGDEIIMEAVRRELAEPLRDAFVTTAATHETLGAKSRRLARDADLAIAGGTNLISSHMGLRPLWRLRPRDAWLGLDVVLMGVGWYQPQRAPDVYTRWLLRRVLHPTACIRSATATRRAISRLPASRGSSTRAARPCGGSTPRTVRAFRGRRPTPS